MSIDIRMKFGVNKCQIANVGVQLSKNPPILLDNDTAITDNQYELI